MYVCVCAKKSVIYTLIYGISTISNVNFSVKYKMYVCIIHQKLTIVNDFGVFQLMVAIIFMKQPALKIYISAIKIVYFFVNGLWSGKNKTYLLHHSKSFLLHNCLTIHQMFLFFLFYLDVKNARTHAQIKSSHAKSQRCPHRHQHHRY